MLMIKLWSTYILSLINQSKVHLLFLDSQKQTTQTLNIRYKHYNLN